MKESAHWSAFFGRFRRIQFRIHPLFAAVAIGILLLCTKPAGDDQLNVGLLAVAVLFVSVAAHEAGHVYATNRMGGSVERIVIGPLGGLAGSDPPREPQADLLAALAGPLINLTVVLATLPVLMALGVTVPPLLHPLVPVGLGQGDWWVVALKLTFWMNWVLLLVNLLPAFPFDGARMLRAALCPAVDFRSAGLAAARTSKLTAVGIFVLAWYLNDVNCAPALAAWVPLSLLGVWIFASASAEVTRLEETDWDEELFSYDFSQGYTSLERTMEPPSRRPNISVRRWLQQRREMRRRKRLFQEQEEERQVDGILMRLHEKGLQGLTAKERAVLERVSQRYRNRQGS